jgi:hypothetical protein
MDQEAHQEEANGQVAAMQGLRGGMGIVDPLATNCSSPASSSPSLASLEQLTDDIHAPNLEISLGRQYWILERPEGLFSLKYM